MPGVEPGSVASAGALSRLAASAPLPPFAVSGGGLSCSSFLAPRVRTFEVHHFPTVGEPIKLKNSLGPFATPSNSQTVEKLAPENQRRKGGGSECATRSAPCLMLRRATWQPLPGCPKEYIFEYIVGARQAKNPAMTRGWGLDVCSIARSTSQLASGPVGTREASTR